MIISRIALMSLLVLASFGSFANNIVIVHKNAEFSSVEDKKKVINVGDLLPESIVLTEYIALEKVSIVKEKVYTPEQKAAIVGLKFRSEAK